MCPCVNTAVCRGIPRHSRSTSCTRPALNGLLVSTSTIPSPVAKAATFENAATNAWSPSRSASSPPMPNRWRWSMSASPRQSRSAMSRRSLAMARSLARRGLGCLPARIGTCFTLSVTTPATSDSPAPDTALARSQAARRRRVLDAALRLAERGGFDAVQMRDVATEANVALGTVYRYFTSKERLLLEAMVEEIEALASRLEARPPAGATPAARVVEVLSRGTASLQRHPEVTGAMVRAFGAADEADVVRRVGDIMTGIITGVMHEGPPSPRDLAVARTLQQVWLSSLIGWVGGVDDPTRVVADLETATQLLLGDGATDGAQPGR